MLCSFHRCLLEIQCMSKTGFKSKDVSINLKENIQKDLFMAWTVQELKSVEVGFGVSSKNTANHQRIFSTNVSFITIVPLCS